MPGTGGPRGDWPSIRLVSPVGLATAATLFLALSMGLVVPKVAGGALLLLGLMSVVGVIRHNGWTCTNIHASEQLVIAGTIGYVCLIALSWLWHGLDPAAGQALGRHARLLLLVPIFLFLRRIDNLAAVWWFGLYAGTVAAGLYAWWFVITGQLGDFESRVGGSTNPIYFGGLALMMTFMCLPRIIDRGLPRWERWLAAVGIVGGVSASLLSGSRGAWLAALPLLVLCAIFFRFSHKKAFLLGLGVMFFVLTIGLALLPKVDMDQRMLAVVQEISDFVDGRITEGGVAERLGMWRITVGALAENVWLGPGASAFEMAVQAAVFKGEALPVLLRYRHPHNQFLSALLYAGIPGLVSLILLFALPMRRFWLLHKGRLENVDQIAWAGLVAVCMLAVMAMTESVFERNIGVVWFSLTVGVTLALITSERRRQLTKATQLAALESHPESH